MNNVAVIKEALACGSQMFHEGTAALESMQAEIIKLRHDNHKLRDVLTWSEQNCPGQCAGKIRKELE